MLGLCMTRNLCDTTAFFFFSNGLRFASTLQGPAGRENTAVIMSSDAQRALCLREELEWVWWWWLSGVGLWAQKELLCDGDSICEATRILARFRTFSLMQPTMH